MTPQHQLFASDSADLDHAQAFAPLADSHRVDAHPVDDAHQADDQDLDQLVDEDQLADHQDVLTDDVEAADEPQVPGDQ